MTPLEQLIQSLKPKKPAGPVGFDPNFLGDDSVDPSVRADAGLGALEGEDRNRLRSEQKLLAYHPESTSPLQVTALAQMLKGTQDQRAASPLRAQEAETDNQRRINLESMNMGFTGENAIEQSTAGTFSNRPTMSPVQQREIYKRKQIEKNDPESLAGIRESGENFRQGRQLNQANRTVLAQMQPSMIYADIAKDAYERSKSNPGAGNNFMDGIKQLGRNGITMQSQPQAPQINPNNLLSAWQKELSYLQGAGNTDPFATFGQPNSPTLSSDNAARALIVNSGLDPISQAEVFDILTNPEDRRLPFDVLAQKHGYDTSDPDIPKMRQLLLQLRGLN